MEGLGFSVCGFNAMLALAGQPATWERALVCPCRTTRTGGADPACAVCQGRGFIWESPQAVTIGLNGVNLRREWAPFSQWENGDIVAIIPSDSPAYRAGEYDRFTLTQAVLPLTMILTRGVNDTLKYRTIQSVLKVWAIVNGAKKEFVEVVAGEGDYTLNGNTFAWVTNELQPGQQYSVLFEAHPEYGVYKDLLHDRPIGGQALPRRVHLRHMPLLLQAVT